jgi:hypothetical protein
LKSARYSASATGITPRPWLKSKTRRRQPGVSVAIVKIQRRRDSRGVLAAVAEPV